MSSDWMKLSGMVAALVGGLDMMQFGTLVLLVAMGVPGMGKALR